MDWLKLTRKASEHAYHAPGGLVLVHSAVPGFYESPLHQNNVLSWQLVRRAAGVAQRWAVMAIKVKVTARPSQDMDVPIVTRHNVIYIPVLSCWCCWRVVKAYRNTSSKLIYGWSYPRSQTKSGRNLQQSVYVHIAWHRWFEVCLFRVWSVDVHCCHWRHNGWACGGRV